MISYLTKVLNVVTFTIQRILLLASLIGKVIVSFVSSISQAVISVGEAIYVFLQIVYEDNVSIFTEELPNYVNAVITATTNQWFYLQNAIFSGTYDIYSKITTITYSIKWLFESIVIVIYDVLILVKKAFILTGDTIWFMITFLPIHVPLIVKETFRQLKYIFINTVVDGYMALLKLTNFLTDVPLESFIGIISAIIIVRLCVHFRENIQSQVCMIYWTLVRKLLFVYYASYNYFTDSEVRAIANMTGEPEMSSRHTSVIEDVANAADALCVICQERQKCVLTLPCRHVCLCTECCMRLYGYQRTCPICRTFIYHSVTVYL